MKYLLIILVAVLASCTSNQADEQQDNKKEDNERKVVATVPINNSAKWKADEATKKNVGAIVQLLNDDTYDAVSKRRQLYSSLQSRIDTLVKQCSMKGPEHDALHVWLEKVLEDMKALKKDEEYTEAFAILKTDVNSFYNLFE